MDWGLVQTGSKRWGLRNTLLISHEDPWPYYAAVVLDLLLRLTWLTRFLGTDGRLGATDMVLTLELVEVCLCVPGVLRDIVWCGIGGFHRGWSIVFRGLGMLSHTV